MRALLCVLLILSLLIQVQSVFACSMMEHQGPAKDCCCELMVMSSKAGACCEFSQQVSFKAAQPDQSVGLLAANAAPDQAPLFLLRSTIKPPEPPGLRLDKFLRDSSERVPSGALIWLSTGRLRI